MEDIREQLGEIKSQLFDAPTEVKSAFNDVVQYFASAKFADDKKYSKWYVHCSIYTPEPGNAPEDDWSDADRTEYTSPMTRKEFKEYWDKEYKGKYADKLIRFEPAK